MSNSNMNIWILNHYAVSPDTPGGTRHYDFSREFVKHGYKVSILASGFSHRTRSEDKLKGSRLSKKESMYGVDFIWLKTSAYYEGNNWRRAVNMISFALSSIIYGLKTREKPDVIIASSPHLFSGLAGWLLSKLKRAKFIFEVRDLWPQTLVDIGSFKNNSPVVMLLRMLERFLYRNAIKIIVLLPGATVYISGTGIPSDKIVYIPNGVSLELFSNVIAELPGDIGDRMDKAKSQGRLTIAYTGAHGEADGLDIIIEAVNSLNNTSPCKADFILIGNGPQKKQLMETVQKRNITNIYFFQPVPKSSMPHLLKSIDIGLVTLKKSVLWRYGTSKNKLYEYMMAARPLIWNVDSLNDPVKDSGCGITVPPENPDEMARAIVLLCSMSQKERAEMGQKGYEYVMKNNSIPVLAEKFLKVLDSVK